jgi:hypothetical protein
MCEITELKQETVTFNCKVIREDVIEVTFKVNQNTAKTIKKIQDKLNIEGKDNLAEIAEYIAEQFQDDVTEFEGIGAIKIDDAQSEKDVKGIGIKIINHCDRKTRVARC